MSEFNDFLKEQLKDPEFRKEWEDIQPEMDVIRAMVDARISQNLTQKELAECTGINQADISKLENGTRNPSLKLLKLKHSQTPSRAGGKSCTQVAINGVAKEQIRQIIADNNFTRLCFSFKTGVVLTEH